MRTIIVDDEPISRELLRKQLALHPPLVVVGEAATFDEAAARLALNDYDVVFLDIQLRGGNGFDLVPHVRRGTRIVFVTAYDSYALRAFEVNALDYLLKPVTQDRFAAAIARLEHSAPSASECDPIPEDAADFPARSLRTGGFTADDRVLVRTDAGDRFVPVTDIAAIFSNGNYSDVQLRTGQRMLTRRPIKTWEEALPRVLFFRVHRQAIVNTACVESHRPDSRETIELRVTGVRDFVGVSRHCVQPLLARLARRAP
jgi:two-component system LytT family response regulator